MNIGSAEAQEADEAKQATNLRQAVLLNSECRFYDESGQCYSYRRHRSREHPAGCFWGLLTSMPFILLAGGVCLCSLTDLNGSCLLAPAAITFAWPPDDF